MSKILIIEDDASFATELGEAICDFGHGSAIAPSGEDALARFDEIGAAFGLSRSALARNART